MQVTHDNLPQAVSGLYDKLDALEKWLKSTDSAKLPESDEILTITQAAAFTDLAVPTLYSKVHKRQIPVCKQGGRLYFSKKELIDWINSGRKKTTAEIDSETINYSKR